MEKKRGEKERDRGKGGRGGGTEGCREGGVNYMHTYILCKYTDAHAHIEIVVQPRTSTSNSPYTFLAPPHSQAPPPN